MSIIYNSVYFYLTITLLAYMLGMFISRKTKISFANPLLISVILVILILKVLKCDYRVYKKNTDTLVYLLTPTTICLAIPLYQKLSLLKKQFKAILLGVATGVFTNVASILLFGYLFNLSKKQIITIFPKSITTAIGMGISEELGGNVTITIAVIIVTGILGNACADIVFRLFKIDNPIARGISLGTSAHAIGTAKAMEYGETEGGMGSLAIVLTGIITVIVSLLFKQFL